MSRRERLEDKLFVAYMKTTGFPRIQKVGSYTYGHVKELYMKQSGIPTAEVEEMTTDEVYRHVQHAYAENFGLRSREVIRHVLAGYFPDEED
jgi:hypothetical protein